MENDTKKLLQAHEIRTPSTGNKLILLLRLFYLSITGLKLKCYEGAKRLIIADAGLDLHPTSLLIGHFNERRFLCCGESWLGAYSILLIGDDPLGGGKRGLFHCGRNVYIGDHCNIRAAGGPIVIGSNVLIANHVTIVSSNHGIASGSLIMEQKWATCPLGVEIGDDCWIGANSVLLPGASVGSGSIIGAGAVVRSHVPSNEIWGGVPAKKIRNRFAN